MDQKLWAIAYIFFCSSLLNAEPQSRLKKAGASCVNLIDLREKDLKRSEICLNKNLETHPLRDPNYRKPEEPEEGVKATFIINDAIGNDLEIGIYGSGYYNYSALALDFFKTGPFFTTRSDPRYGGPIKLMHLNGAILTKYVWGIHTAVLGSYYRNALLIDGEDINRKSPKIYETSDYPPSPRRITEVSHHKVINAGYRFHRLIEIIDKKPFKIKDIFQYEYKFPSPENFQIVVASKSGPISVTNGGPFILIKKTDKSIIRNHFFHVTEIQTK